MATNFFDPLYLENCHAALFAKVQEAVFPAGLKINTFQRVTVGPDQVSVADMPALFQVPGPLHARQAEFSLTKWTFVAYWLLYVRADATQPIPNPLPSTQAFNLIWGIMGTLLSAGPPYEKQTLGGLVYHCWIEGEVEVQTSSEQIVIGIPVYMDAGNVS